MRIAALTLIAAVAAVCSAPARGEAILFPPDAGVVDVTKAPWNIPNDGKTDVTAALQKVLDDRASGNRIVYLPDGTYLISDTLKWPAGAHGGVAQKRTILQGQSQAGTILKLADGVARDAAKPRAMLWTGKAPAQRFRNAVRNLTLDIGQNNPAAIGAQFIANNQGAFREVTLVAPAGSGLIGLDLSYSDEIGPLLVKNIEVRGFAVGIRLAYSVDSSTLEHVTLRGQRQAGLENIGQCVSIRGLVSENAPDVPAVVNGANPSVMAILDAAVGDSGLTNQGVLYARNITGKVRGAAAAGGEWTHPRIVGGTRGLALPVRETPAVPWHDLAQWTGPHHFGGTPQTTPREKPDASAALQQALAAGRKTVYFPNGQWHLEKDVTVPPGVQRLIGCEARVSGPGRVIVRDGTDPLIIERIDGIYDGLKVHHDGTRTLVLSSCTLTYTAREAAGDLFLDDVCGAPWHFTRQNVWARQLNPENEGTKIVNDAGNLWVLGLKTERAGTLVDTRNGGSTEVVGGFCYTTARKKHDAPMFALDAASHLSVTLGEAAYARFPFEALIRATRDGDPTVLKKGQTPGRLFGSAIPLWSTR